MKRPPASSLGGPLFQECPSSGALPYTKLILSWLKCVTELVLQIFCAHYGRHLPFSQACHTMLPGLSLYFAKTRTWTGPYYQCLVGIGLRIEPCN